MNTDCVHVCVLFCCFGLLLNKHKTKKKSDSNEATQWHMETVFFPFFLLKNIIVAATNGIIHELRKHVLVISPYINCSQHSFLQQISQHIKLKMWSFQTTQKQQANTSFQRIQREFEATAGKKVE